MERNRLGALTGIAFGIVALPLLHLSVVDFENKSLTDAQFGAQVASRYLSISIASGLGLLLVAILIFHIYWLSGYFSSSFILGAKVARGCALVTASALAMGFGFSLIASYGAHEKRSDIAIRTVALIAENLGTSLLVGLAVFAGLIMTSGLRRELPKWIAILAGLEVLATLVSTVVGIPAASALVTITWVLVNSIGLYFHVNKEKVVA